MAQRSKLIVLSAVFVVLLATYVVGSIVTSRAGRSPVAGESVVAESLVSDSRSIRLTGAGEEALETFLTRSDGGRWQIRLEDGLYPADTDRVDGLIDALGAMEKVRVAATGSDYHQDFDVAGEAARDIVLLGENDQELARVVFGKAVAGGGRMYARREGDDRVFIIDRDIGSYFGQNAPYWSDLRPLPDELTQAAVTRISADGDLQIDEETRIADRFTLYRDGGNGGGTWRLEGPDGEAEPSLDQAAVDSLASAVTELEAQSFVTRRDVETGLSNPSATVSFEDDSGGSYTVRIGNSAGEERFYMRVTGDGVDVNDAGEPFLYAVSSYQVRRILKNRDALISEADARAGEPGEESR